MPTPTPASPDGRPTESSPLSVVGLTAAHEGLYRGVLHTPGRSLAELATTTGIDRRRLSDQVDTLCSLGLLVRQGESVAAAPPGVALERLIADETRRLHAAGEQLEAVRALVPTLAAEHRRARAQQREPVLLEWVGVGDLLSVLRNLSTPTAGDLRWLRPAPWQTPETSGIDDWVVEVVGSGQRSRAIYPSRVIDEVPYPVRARAEAGEHVRVLAHVPQRFVVVGSSAVLLAEDTGADSLRLLVREPVVVAAVAMVFDSLWERAMSVPGLGEVSTRDTLDDRRLLIDLLASGARDEQIAGVLGISLRTVRRRVAELLTELDASSRFQAGAEAVRRGRL